MIKYHSVGKKDGTSGREKKYLQKERERSYENSKISPSPNCVQHVTNPTLEKGIVKIWFCFVFCLLNVVVLCLFLLLGVCFVFFWGGALLVDNVCLEQN